jgi:hypothetical protein
MAERPSTSLLNDGQTRHLLAVMSLAAAIARDLAGTPAQRGDALPSRACAISRMVRRAALDV